MADTKVGFLNLDTPITAGMIVLGALAFLVLIHHGFKGIRVSANVT